MRKDKKLRVVAIIALTISVLGLTLGFAAFSNEIPISTIRIICYGVLPAAAALVTFVSYKAGKNQIARDL